MTISDRDRKIIMIFVPLLVVVAYWFLLLSPKRHEASTAGDELSQQQQRLDSAKAAAGEARGAQSSFESDFAELVRLGKAIPASVDMPSLIVQLDRAAEGTGIRFTKIATGDRQTGVPTAAPGASAATTSGGSSSASTSSSGSSSSASGSSSSPPVAAGGASAQSAPGGAVESANNAAATSNQQSAAAEQSGVNPPDTQTSTSSKSGGVPVGGGSTSTSSTTSTTGATPAGLETVPLDLEFVGDFFNLADFFHSVKRFVRVANQNVLVGGRLITIEGVSWSSDPELFPRIKAKLTATVYLSPKSEGTTAGATPQGPATQTTTPAGTSSASSGSSPVPTATATAPR